MPDEAPKTQETSAHFMQTGDGHCFMCHKDHQKQGGMCSLTTISPCMENECEERWRAHNPLNKPLETGNPTEATETSKEGVKELEKGEKSENKAPERDEMGKFQPGHGLPGPGRPPGSISFKNAIIKWAEKEVAKLPDGSMVTQIELIGKKLVELAAAGKVKAIEMIGDRLDGKPRQTIDATIDSRTAIDPDKQALVNEAVKDLFKKP